MRYIRNLQLSGHRYPNTNIYPYRILHKKAGALLTFDRITIFYGDNGSGKSTLLNIIANLLQISGGEPPTKWGIKDYYSEYLSECHLVLEDDDEGRIRRRIPDNSRYLKSEDILYEIKKIQQESVLEEGYIYERRQLGMTKEEIAMKKGSYKWQQQLERLQFAQEKYSNGETAMQIFEDYLKPDALYLLDEPEASLSPENQLKLATTINDLAHYLDCQFVIATHSPILLGMLEATIYNLDLSDFQTQKWSELENVRQFAKFFFDRQGDFKL
ncbi:AAA family ATPase [Pseudolactococcus yaeyamensis]